MATSDISGRRGERTASGRLARPDVFSGIDYLRSVSFVDAACASEVRLLGSPPFHDWLPLAVRPDIDVLRDAAPALSVVVPLMALPDRSCAGFPVAGLPAKSALPDGALPAALGAPGEPTVLAGVDDPPDELAAASAAAAAACAGDC